MKKLFAIFSISLFIIFGCQEASSVVAPNDGNALPKQGDSREFDISDQDSSDLPNAPDPVIPRI